MVLKSMKKMSVFLIFTVMLPSISWGGVADGKSIICHCINCSLTTEERGWAFLDGKVTYVFPSTYKDEVTIKEESWGNYWSDENTIGWTHEGMGRVLDRSTLIITDTYSNPHETSRCEIFQSRSEFKKEWETIRIRIQSEYDLKLKNNKI